jgi:hypothetical protein
MATGDTFATIAMCETKREHLHGKYRKHPQQTRTERCVNNVDLRQDVRKRNGAAKDFAVEEEAGRVSPRRDRRHRSEIGTRWTLRGADLSQRDASQIWVLTTEEAKDAEATVKQLREFVGLPH